ncbi:MAG: hypothetical protein AAF433_16445 [Bacteroidota bacterium]
MQYLEFDGKARNFLVVGLGAFLLTLFTLGLGTPWATTMLLKWKTKHTIVEGRRLIFKGEGSALFGKWILWWFLTLITLGLYGLIVWPRYQRWITENTAILEYDAQTAEPELENQGFVGNLES